MRRASIISLMALLIILLAATAWILGRAAYFYAGPAERLLSETGYDREAMKTGASPTTLPFAPQYPFWSDGARKGRRIYLPPGQKIDNSDPDRWNFPAGTRIWKEFERDETLVETRMLYKFGRDPWQWDMAVYQWREDRSDAEKLMFGKSDVENTPHDIPAPAKCLTCHGAGKQRRPLGVTAVQLPWESEYGLSIRQLIENDRLTDPPKTAYEIPGDALSKSALGYLDTNCGTCHYENSAFVDENIPLKLNLTTDTLASMDGTNAYHTAVNKTPMAKGLGTEVYIRPGKPDESFIYKRMSIRDNGGWQMPPLATEKVDEDGAALIARWISAMPAPTSKSGGPSNETTPNPQPGDDGPDN